ncbi:nuclease-related domain-containing protein [Solibacillus sp. FSL H8-0538]|uniref:nuclease-related domain-containing protein n=1 Tax=Solibacillus sp. FSL H8-0538 TaxID=2921400 RepID=UPI0030F9FA93
MTFWLIFVIISLFGYFAFSLYKHDDTIFSKITGYSYFDLWTNKKALASKKLLTVLNHVEGSHKILLDLLVPSASGTRHVDAVLLHESGIYIIDLKHMSGWISGREQDEEWVQLFHREKQRAFANPIHENRRSIFALQDALPEINYDLFETLILFTDSCSFQQIEIHSQNADVIKTTELKAWLTQLSGEVLSQTDIESIYKALEGMVQGKNALIKKQTKAVSLN